MKYSLLDLASVTEEGTAATALHNALKAYRDNFRPSQYLDKPYVAAAMNVFAADSETEARYMMSSMQQQFIALRLGIKRALSNRPICARLSTFLCY